MMEEINIIYRKSKKGKSIDGLVNPTLSKNKHYHRLLMTFFENNINPRREIGNLGFVISLL
jgi:hypothetical protein